MVPVIEFLASAGLGLDLTTMAWTLAFGACFGGERAPQRCSVLNRVACLVRQQACSALLHKYWCRALAASPPGRLPWQ